MRENLLGPTFKSISSQKALLITALVLAAIAAVGAAEAQGTGYWSTTGSRIVDASGSQMRISGVNWYGFETVTKVPHGLTSQDYHAVLKAIYSNGYNTVRLPFSNDMVENPIVPSSISYSNGSGAINADLQGLNSIQIMDKIIAAAGQAGLKVILDNHRSEAGNSAEANGLWYTSSYPESRWIADWVTLTQRYSSYADGSGNPTVIGMDLRNEPHNATSGGACWTGDSNSGGCPLSSPNNWPAAAQRAASSILNSNPKLLIFVEGVDEYNNDWDWWGGNLEGANSNPVHLSFPNKLVYSPHDYGPHEYGQTWFNGSTTASSLQAVWTKFWGFLSLNGTAPVWVGEFGTTNNSADIQNGPNGSQGQWFSSFVGFLASNPNISWTYWALNGEDSYGLLDSNYDTVPVSALKQQQLSSIQFAQGTAGGSPPPAPASCSSAPAAPASAAATPSSSTQIRISWSAVNPPPNCTASYSLFRSTVNGFVPSQGNQIASGLTSTGFGDSGLNSSTTYYYAVRTSDSVGASSSALASATTLAPTPMSAGCHIGYSITNQWPGGFQVALSIVNNGSAAVSGWNLQWSFPTSQKVSSLWNANWSQSSQAVILTNLSYNGNIPAGGTYNGIGFTGSVSGSNAVPSNFALNGVRCN